MGNYPISYINIVYKARLSRQVVDDVSDAGGIIDVVGGWNIGNTNRQLSRWMVIDMADTDCYCCCCRWLGTWTT